MPLAHSSHASRGLSAALLGAALAVLLAGGQPSAQVGPNGEIDGLTATFADVNGVRTRFYEYGQGEPMVMLHGGARAGANVFSRNIPGLAKRFRVFAVDRVGYGLTDNPRTDADLGNEGQVRFVRDFIETMKLGPVHLVGHSSGGAVAFYFAVDHPDLVKTLIVLAHGPGMPPLGDGPSKLQAELDKCPPVDTFEHRSCRLAALAHNPDTFPPDFWKAEDMILSHPKWKQLYARQEATAAQRAGQTESYRERMWERARNGGLTMPTLIYGGKQDTLDWDADDPHAMLRGELDFFDIVGARNPRVKFIVVNEAGHFPYREHPDQFNADLIHFIDFWNAHPKTTPETAYKQ